MNAVLVLLLASHTLMFAGTIEKPMYMTTELHFGAQGPYRFLVDTGAEGTTIDTKLASELGLVPQFRVEVVNVHGSRFVPGAYVNRLRLNTASIPRVEVMIDDPVEARRGNASVRGVLGLNVLKRVNYLLEPKAGRMDAGAPRPDGEAIPFSESEGRIVVTGRMGQESLSFVLDSGSSHVVLFRTPAAMARTRPMESTLKTLDGESSTVPTTWTSEIVFSGRLRVGTLPAAIVMRVGSKVDGLLPAAAFSRVFVDHARHELVVPR